MFTVNYFINVLHIFHSVLDQKVYDRQLTVSFELSNVRTITLTFY